jgi:hypothetical protein
MHLDGELAAVQLRAARLGMRVVADERWLTGEFLRDALLDPQRYIDRAEEHKSRQRQLLTLTRRLLEIEPARLVA